MASAFGHVAVAYAMGKTMDATWASPKFWGFSMFCCLLPDADVLGLLVGIPYEHVLGHRGITHSIVFAMLIGLVVPSLVVSSNQFWTREYAVLIIYFGLVTMSHGLLDAFTNGGLGIAFFAPFDTTRYFFPWRPIAVSPIGLSNFFSSWGVRVLLSELVWIGIPVTFWLLCHRLMRRKV